LYIHNSGNTAHFNYNVLTHKSKNRESFLKITGSDIHAH